MSRPLSGHWALTNGFQFHLESPLLAQHHAQLLLLPVVIALPSVNCQDHRLSLVRAYSVISECLISAVAEC